jgi:peptidoglycan biosynthesis protein MviN/MurJ (putative lipid II flippase)
MTLDKFLKKQIKINFYRVIFKNMDDNSFWNFKFISMIILCFLSFMFFKSPYKFLKLICALIPLIHGMFYDYYVMMYSLETPELVRNSGVGFIEIIFSSLVASLSGQFVSISSTFMYTRIDKGILSFSSVADRSIQAPIGILSAALSATLLPKMSRMIKNNDLPSAQKEFNAIISYLFLLSIPVVFICYNFSGIFFNIIFSNTQRTVEDIAQIVQMFRTQITFLPFAILCKVCNIVYFCIGKHKIATIISWITSGICIITKISMLNRTSDYLVMSLPQGIGWLISSILLVLVSQFYSKSIDALDPIKSLFMKRKNSKKVLNIK